MALDTYAFAKKLQESGFTPQQVEALLDTVRGVIGEDLATKQDIEHLRSEMAHKIELARRDTIIWLGSIIVIALTAQSVLMKLL